MGRNCHKLASSEAIRASTETNCARFPKRDLLEKPTRTRSKKKPRCWPFFPNRQRRLSPPRHLPARAKGKFEDSLGRITTARKFESKNRCGEASRANQNARRARAPFR